MFGWLIISAFSPVGTLYNGSGRSPAPGTFRSRTKSVYGNARQRTATIRREQTAKNATNVFRNSNNPNALGFKHLVDIERVTGSIPVAPTIQSHQTTDF
jgi:hypothetical protein